MRVIPIFPELRQVLEEAWENAEPGAVYVLPTIRDAKRNLRTWLERIISRAGLVPWPRLWQNMRASRATELADEYPGHVAAAWLGHCERIADAHYRQVTDEHFARASHQPTYAAQNAAQHLHAESRTEPLLIPPIASFAAHCGTLPIGATPSIGPEGFEPPTKGL